MSEQLDRIDAFRILREKIKEYGNQRIFAQEVGITPQYLSDMLCGRKPLSDAILKFIGLRRKEYFLRTGE
ncbi:transcriptional regulator [Gluconacetobacter entanii]|uniref:Transcriptional regulator n=1 Tax=Gluconacetobacter entanii TaxID=108528 RepID=A0A318PSK2_9PROT|nr:transcriptional regulator [Gluconacetobacter entanii]PYD63541.1 transcriptional regulator [Gluconacetobacter entanii]